MTPTARSLALLRSRGLLAERVECWNPWAKVRQDLLQIGDVIFVGKHIGLVQVTTSDHLAEREAKLRAHPNAKAWLQAGGKLWVHGWAKRGARGERKRWQCTEREIAG